MAWVDYRRRYGSLNPIHRAHQDSVLSSFRIASSMGAKLDLDKLFVYPIEQEEEPVEAGINAIAAAFSARPAQNVKRSSN